MKKALLALSFCFIGATSPESPPPFRLPQWPSDVGLAQLSMTISPRAASFASCDAADFVVTVTNTSARDLPFTIVQSKFVVRDAAGHELSSDATTMPFIFPRTADLKAHGRFYYTKAIGFLDAIANADCPPGVYTATLSHSLLYLSDTLTSAPITFVVR